MLVNQNLEIEFRRSVTKWIGLIIGVTFLILVCYRYTVTENVPIFIFINGVFSCVMVLNSLLVSKSSRIEVNGLILMICILGISSILCFFNGGMSSPAMLGYVFTPVLSYFCSGKTGARITLALSLCLLVLLAYLEYLNLTWPVFDPSHFFHFKFLTFFLCSICAHGIGSIYENSRRRTEAQLKNREEYLRSILESSPACIEIIDSNGNILFINSPGLELLEAKNIEEVLGKSIFDFIKDTTHKNNFIQINQKMCEKLGTENLEYELLTLKGNSRIFQSHSASLTQLNGQRVHICISQDITDRRKAEKEIEHQKSQLISASKMASLGEMAGGIAHEINNPLTIVLGRIGVLRKKIERNILDPAKINEDFEKALQAGTRISKIIQGLLSISRTPETDSMKPTSVHLIIENTVEFYMETFKNLGIEFKCIKDCEAQIFCRESQIIQTLMNLLANAKDAVEKLPTKWIQLHCSQDEKWVYIKITDSGTGIAPEVAEKMMQPFFTNKEIGKGTGLGLSIALGIVQQHGGKLYYDAEAPHTTFVLQLPL